MDIINLLGRFHPVVLHLPIGALLVGFLLEVLSRKEKYTALKSALGPILLFSGISAVVAAIFGYFLSLEGGYDDQLLSWHQWSGIGLAVLTLGLYWAQQRSSKGYFPLFLLTLIMLTLAGHFGGSLTHGTDYLTAGLTNKKEGAFNEEVLKEEILGLPHLDSALVFRHVVQPVLEDKCVSCHRPGKAKGELLLHDQKGILAGGENGAALVANDPEQSLLIQRIHLPNDDEEHMPPNGKKQLDKEDKALLSWWIQQGAVFDKTLGGVEVSKQIASILEDRLTFEQGVWALDIKPIKESKLQQIKKSGVPIMPMAQNSPFLEVDFAGLEDIDEKTLRQLKKASNQIVRLNLSGTPVKDGMLSVLKSLPNLSYLNLSNTGITDRVLDYIKNHEYLEYLNLYGTDVSDNGLEKLKTLPRLKQLYLWQTGVSDNGAQMLSQQLPDLYLDMGMEQDTTFKSVQLTPPVIKADEELFEDSVEVTLDLNFKGVAVFYTIDGSQPDTSSLLYEQPFILKDTRKVKAIAHKDGWKMSPVVEKQFVQVRYKPLAVKLQNAPSPKYPANGPESLMDFRKGSERFQDGLWMGWEKDHAIATIDLGDVKTVSSITVGALENVQSWIFYPKGVKAWVSKDGKQFKQVLDSNYPIPDAPTDPSTKNITEHFDEASEARYVKIMVENILANPDWHPNPGGGSWVFIDEILVQ